MIGGGSPHQGRYGGLGDAPGTVSARARSRSKNVTGVWRSSGTSRQGGSSLFLLQSGDDIVGSDTDARGRLRGKVRVFPGGQIAVEGVYEREDGRTGAFVWKIARGGGTFTGTWVGDNGRSGTWSGVKQGDEITPGLSSFLSKRHWGGGLGELAGNVEIKKCWFTVMGQKIHQIPCGASIPGPGGTQIAIDKDGVNVKPKPKPKGYKPPAPPPPDAPDEEKQVSEAKTVMYGLLGVSALALVIGVVLLARR